MSIHRSWIHLYPNEELERVCIVDPECCGGTRVELSEETQGVTGNTSRGVGGGGNEGFLQEMKWPTVEITAFVKDTLDRITRDMISSTRLRLRLRRQADRQTGSL